MRCIYKQWLKEVILQNIHWFYIDFFIEYQCDATQCSWNLTQCNVCQCIDFFPNWPQNQHKINVLMIEVHTLIQTISGIIATLNMTPERLQHCSIPNSYHNSDYSTFLFSLTSDTTLGEIWNIFQRSLLYFWNIPPFHSCNILRPFSSLIEDLFFWCD